MKDKNMKKDNLTNTRKVRRIYTDSVLSFIKVFVVAKAMMRDLRKDCTDWKMWRMVRHTFGKFVIFFRRKAMSSKLKKIYSLVAVVALAVLVGCGGGGGGGGSNTTPPVTVTQTVTCPDGVSKTGTGTTASAALDAATAQCAAPTLVSITPADKATVSPDVIASNGVVIATSSTLATPAINDITLKAGVVSVPVTVTMTSGNKGFKFVPSTKPLFAQVYTYVVGVTDTLGKKLSIIGSFTTSSVSCVAPAVWNAGVKICESPSVSPLIGANQLPVGCDTRTKQCWPDAIANGTVKAIASGATDGAGYAVTILFFRNTTSFGGVNGLWMLYPVRSIDGSPTTNSAGVPANPSDIWSGITNEVTTVWGSQGGAILKMKVGLTESCRELTYNKTTNAWEWTNNTVNCPSI